MKSGGREGREGSGEGGEEGSLGGLIVYVCIYPLGIGCARAGAGTMGRRSSVVAKAAHYV